MATDAADAAPAMAANEPAAKGRFGALRRLDWGRLLLLGLILGAFLHVVLYLDVKALWWDESLSLQRAEEDLVELVRGVLWIRDGFTDVPTIDQHPFFSFLLQGGLIRLAGNDEFVLRFIAAAAATLMAPMLWVLARWFVRRDVFPASAPWWAALLAAVNPFLLWYGQEARPYALWALLAVLTTYLALRATEGERLDWRFAAAFVVAELAFVATHYYATFLLPVHALIFFVWLARRSLVKALAVAAGVILLGALVGGYAAWIILGQGGGQNFPQITLGMLIPDLLNAFALGLSVDLARVWWMDWVFGALALLGALWGLRSRAALRNGGWVLPAFFVLPISILLLLNEFSPVYMNARHMSLLVGAFVLAVGAGLGWLWQRQRWVAGALAIGLLLATGYSTVNYYTQEEYAKDDYVRLGEYMAGRIMPGDVVLFYPSSSWRVFEYYLPLEPVHEAAAAGEPLAVYGIPLLRRPLDETTQWLQEDIGRRFQRLWVIKSRTHPYYDLEDRVENWLKDHFLMVRNAQFFSHSSLRAQLYLPEIPVFDALPADVAHPVTVEYGDLIRLAGYTGTMEMDSALPSPVKLYWQVLAKPAKRYKYILQLVEQKADGQQSVLSAMEREPYEGDIPTLYWDPGKTILEFVEMPPAPAAPAPDSELFWTFQLYDGETLEKLPATKVEGGELLPDGVTVRLPYDY